MAVLAAGGSQAIQGISPSAALSLNPFNNEARIEAIAQGLQDYAEGQNAHLVDLAQGGSRLNPSDARFLSLLGLIKTKAGKTEAAQAYFVAALSITPTEIQALFNRLSFFLSTNDLGRALPLVELIARRWPEQWPRVEPYLPNLLATPEAIANASRVLANDPIGRFRMMASLTKQPATLDYAVWMLEQWKSDNVSLTELRPLSVSVSNALFSAKDYTRAYFLFRSLLDSDQQKVAGYIHNSQFNQQPSQSMFDWRMRTQPGATMAFRPNGFEVRFRDNPVQFSGLQQYFRLPPGNFSLNVDYSTSDLVTPKPLRLLVNCIGASGTIANIELEPATQKNTMASDALVVPEVNCPALRVVLANDFAALSWNNRYRGSLILHSVNVERVAGASGS